MTYGLGIDLGTTFTAAATWQDGRVETASLGNRAPTIPSVVLRRADDTFLIGDPAEIRGRAEPHRVAREFKRRLGDPTPILLAGAPYSAEALTAQLLRDVIAKVHAEHGTPPATICLSHPANWGPYKQDLLGQAVRLAGLPVPATGRNPAESPTVTFTTEPEAAAISYAHQQRLSPGAMVAVYDLGGGTFDATVLRTTAGGFELLGTPEGIDQLGGIDFDAAVLEHVRQALGDTLTELDEEDPAVLSALARLRDECTQAREQLSADTDVAIPVTLPGHRSTTIRLTRTELETMIRPALGTTIEALRRALQNAQVEPDQLHSVLLVGGASRTPLVAQLVGAELGRPVAVDTHPKYAVALGAAHRAGSAAPPAGPPRPTPPPTAGPQATAVVPAVPASPALAAAASAAPADPTPAAEPEGFTRGRATVPPPRPAGTTAAMPATEPDQPPDPEPNRRRRPPAALAAAGVALLLLAGAGIALAVSGNPFTTRTIPPAAPPAAESPSPTAPATVSPTPAPPAPPPPPLPPPGPPPAAPPSPTPSPTPDLIPVPDVIAQGCAPAKTQLEAAGFVVSVDGPGALVTGQSPAGGELLPAGSPVTIECPQLG